MNVALFPIRHPRFRLDVPAEWPKKDVGAHLSEYAVADNVTLRVRWMTHLVIDEVSWIEAVMREDFSKDVKLTRTAFEATQSDRGWPMVFAAYKVQDGATVEERIGGFYRIVHTHGEAVIRLKNGVSWTDWAPKLRPLLLAGHVDWPIYQEQELMYPLLGMRA